MMRIGLSSRFLVSGKARSAGHSVPMTKLRDAVRRAKNTTFPLKGKKYAKALSNFPYRRPLALMMSPASPRAKLLARAFLFYIESLERLYDLVFAAKHMVKVFPL